MHGDWGGKTKFAVQAGQLRVRVQPQRGAGGGDDGAALAAVVARIRGKSGDGVVPRTPRCACMRAGRGWGWGSALGLGVGQSMPLHCPTRDLDTKMCVIDGYCAVAAAPAYHSVTIVLACLLFTHPQKLRAITVLLNCIYNRNVQYLFVYSVAFSLFLLKSDLDLYLVIDLDHCQ